VEPLRGLLSKGWLLDLRAIIRLEWRRSTVKNTLAFYDVKLITTVNCIIIQATSKLIALSRQG
jgi:hypothetical protein